MCTLVRKRDFRARFPFDLSCHDVVAPAIWIFSSPDGGVRAGTSPSLVEVGLRGISNLMKPRSVRVDDADRCLPHADLGMVLDAPEEDKFVTRF